MKIDSSRTEIDRADVEQGRAIGVKPCRVGAFAIVAIQVELDRHAVGNTAAAASGIRAIAESATGRPQSGVADTLDGEGEAVGGIGAGCDLEGEGGGEAADTDWGGGEDTAGFGGTAVGELEVVAADGAPPLKVRTPAVPEAKPLGKLITAVELIGVAETSLDLPLSPAVLTAVTW